MAANLRALRQREPGSGALRRYEEVARLLTNQPTATADVGYVEKLPYRRPPPELEIQVADRVDRIIVALQGHRDADVSDLRAEIDELVFDLFEIRASREEVRRFYETVGRVMQEEPEADQAASE